MKEDEALISEWLCSASPRPVPPPPPNQQRQTVKQVACSISLHPAPPPQSGSSQRGTGPSFSSPLSILYLGFTERLLSKYKNIHMRSYGSAGREHNSAAATYRPRCQADTNILITHGCEGFRGGDGSGVRACAALTHSLLNSVHVSFEPCGQFGVYFLKF